MPSENEVCVPMKGKTKPKTPEQIHKELQSWDKLMGRKDYDQGYVLGFRMALKWALGIKPPRTKSQHRGGRQA